MKKTLPVGILGGRLRILFLTGVMVLLYSSIAWAEAIPPRLGTVNLYSSHNHEYTIAIEILGYPDGSPSGCTFQNSANVIWSKIIPTTPGKVAISDNGATIVMTNWGWYDEGGSCSLSIYNHKGDLIKEIPFGRAELGIEPMRWIHTLAIASDGTYCMTGENGREHAIFSFYDCRTATGQWEAECGFSESREVKIANNGAFVLVATRDYDSGDMRFFLLDKEGAILWQQKLAKNFSWDVPNYQRFADNGKEFEIFDLNQAKYIKVAIPE